MNVRVISASWGSYQPDQALADAIVYADAKGAVFVTAAGNDGVNNDVKGLTPNGWFNLGGYDYKNVWFDR